MKKYAELSIHQKINVRSYISQFKSERPTDFIFEYKDYPITKSLYSSHCEPYCRTIQTPKHQAVQEKIVLHTVKRMNKNRRKNLAIHRKLNAKTIDELLTAVTKSIHLNEPNK